MSTHFYSCRQLLGLQVQRFVEQQKVSLKWITQDLSISGRKWSKVSLSSNPAIKIQEVSCVPNTPNTLFRCIGALVRRRDSEIQVVWMIISGNGARKELLTGRKTKGKKMEASKHITDLDANGVSLFRNKA